MTSQYNGMKMTDGTEYRVLLDFTELIETINAALKRGELLTVPMGITRPGKPHTVNPQHVVSLTDYQHL